MSLCQKWLHISHKIRTLVVNSIVVCDTAFLPLVCSTKKEVAPWWQKHAWAAIVKCSVSADWGGGALIVLGCSWRRGRRWSVWAIAAIGFNGMFLGDDWPAWHLSTKLVALYPFSLCFQSYPQQTQWTHFTIWRLWGRVDPADWVLDHAPLEPPWVAWPKCPWLSMSFRVLLETLSPVSWFVGLGLLLEQWPSLDSFTMLCFGAAVVLTAPRGLNGSSILHLSAVYNADYSTRS